MTSGAPGQIRIDPRRPMISCPWHGWEYDLESGQSFVQVDPGARSYAVSIERGCELVGTTIAEPERQIGVPGPYVVETFDVTVDERDYVVLELGVT
jgi:nitrite reductase/ring-hydroxylating ferredoxin subunit